MNEYYGLNYLSQLQNPIALNDNFKAKTKDLFKLLSLNPLLRSYFGDLKIIRKVAQDNKFMTHFIRAIIWKPSYMQTMLEPNRLYLLPQQQKTSKPDKSEQPHFHHAINKSYNFKQCK